MPIICRQYVVAFLCVQLCPTEVLCFWGWSAGWHRPHARMKKVWAENNADFGKAEHVKHRTASLVIKPEIPDLHKRPATKIQGLKLPHRNQGAGRTNGIGKRPCASSFCWHAWNWLPGGSIQLQHALEFGARLEPGPVEIAELRGSKEWAECAWAEHVSS